MSESPAETHPSSEELRRFGSGEMRGPEWDAIEGHVATCAVCYQRLRELPPDPLLNRLQAVVGRGDPGQSPAPVPDQPTLPHLHANTPLNGSPLPQAPSVPDYEILEVLGRGGMGVVYKARQIKADRLVALKMVLAGEMATPDAIERFKTDARAAAHLNHPNIVPIYHVGEHAGRQYFTMKLIPAGSLAKQVAGRPLPPRRAAKIVRDVARAIHYAHEQKVIHRDLKPENILLDEADQPHVTDFGLAKRLDGEVSPTHQGDVLGTPEYMAPEQADGRGKEATAATDVYGLGAVLYKLLTGRPPFKGKTVFDTLLQVRHKQPHPPQSFNPKIHQDLQTICLKCLEKDPGQRYPTAEEVAKELNRYLESEPIEARPPNWLARVLRKQHKVIEPLSWSYVALLGAAVTFCTHSAIFWITQPGGPTFLFAPCVGINAVLSALIFWICLFRRREPFTPEEWHIFYICSYFVSTAFVLYAAAFPWDRESILALYPALALLTGLYHFVLARLYWGPLYLDGLVFYLLAIVMKLTPEWAPLEFAVISGGHGLASGLILRKPRED